VRSVRDKYQIVEVSFDEIGYALTAFREGREKGPANATE
jgi:hypothetical protein